MLTVLLLLSNILKLKYEILPSINTLKSRTFMTIFLMAYWFTFGKQYSNDSAWRGFDYSWRPIVSGYIPTGCPRHQLDFIIMYLKPLQHGMTRRVIMLGICHLRRERHQAWWSTIIFKQPTAFMLSSIANTRSIETHVNAPLESTADYLEDDVSDTSIARWKGKCDTYDQVTCFH